MCSKCQFRIEKLEFQAIRSFPSYYVLRRTVAVTVAVVVAVAVSVAILQSEKKKPTFSGCFDRVYIRSRALCAVEIPSAKIQLLLLLLLLLFFRLVWQSVVLFVSVELLAKISNKTNGRKLGEEKKKKKREGKGKIEKKWVNKL